MTDMGQIYRTAEGVLLVDGASLAVCVGRLRRDWWTGRTVASLVATGTSRIYKDERV